MKEIELKTSVRQDIWICRHGNRIDFVDPSWKGSDPPLSPDGVVQAKETGIRLRNEGIQHIFSSPFLRTVETAHYIAEALDLSIKIEQGVCEWLNANWFPTPPIFLPLNEMRRRFPRIDETYISRVSPKFPESREEVNARCRAVANSLADTSRSSILIIGHGASVLGMTRALMGEDLSIKPGLCALVKIVRENGSARLALDGDSSHLSGGEAQRDRFN